MAAPPPADLRLDPDDRRPLARRRTRVLPIVLGLAVGVAGIVAWVWWSQRVPEPAVVARNAPPADAPPAAPVPNEPAIQYPVLAPPDGQPALQEGEVPEALAQLLGRGATLRHIETDDFPRRFVATLDNLARAHAPPLAWPVAPTLGRFTVENRPDGTQVIAAQNAQRYTPFVDFATSLDSAASVKLYARMYPVLQQAYRHLGFGDRYLNDRVVAVIDHLLAAPEPGQPVQVRLTEVKGPVPSTRPWVRYEFVDPALERLSAGQKILVRMGPENEKRLKQKLRELRAALVQAQPAR